MCGFQMDGIIFCAMSSHHKSGHKIMMIISIDILLAICTLFRLGFNSIERMQLGKIRIWFLNSNKRPYIINDARFILILNMCLHQANEDVANPLSSERYEENMEWKYASHMRILVCTMIQMLEFLLAKYSLYYSS